MLKKAFFLLNCALAVTTTAFGMELINIQTASKTALREYQKCVMRLKKLEQLNADIYAKTIPSLTKIIEAENFKTKVNALVQEQATSIIEQNGTLAPLAQESTLTDYLPEASSVNKYIQVLFSLIAKKEYYKLLWQKLSSKEKELNKEVEQRTNELLNEITSS